MEIGIFSLNNDIIRPTKIMNNRADKNWAHFYKTKYFKNQRFINENWSQKQSPFTTTINETSIVRQINLSNENIKK